MGDCKTVALALSMSAVVLTGCASAGAGLGAPSRGETDDPLAEPAEAYEMAAPAFHFESGTLELGDFDPATLGDDLFDPCTEISEAEFAAAGITGVAPLNGGRAHENGATGCTANPALPGTFRTVIANPANEEVLRQDEIRHIVTPSSSDIPGVFTHWPDSETGRSCFAQVDTVRGGLAISVSINSRRKTDDDPCELASESLNELYVALK